VAGILRWAINGCLAWQQEGLARPASVTDATEAYFSCQDTLASWLEENCIVERDNPYRFESFPKLFASWVVYAKAAGEEPGNRRTFGERMRRKGFVSEQIYACNGKGFRGVELKSAKVEEDER
jgi:putative DNA primase/helicase